jgi:molybdate transport system ATP-binding protein
VVLSLLLLAVSVAVLVGLRDRWLTGGGGTREPGRRPPPDPRPVRPGRALQVRAGEVVACSDRTAPASPAVCPAWPALLPVDAGHVRLGDDVHDDPAAGTFVPPQARGVGVVFQDYLLFPHLSALENVAFGLRAAGRPRGRPAARRRRWLERMGLAGARARRPTALSGGQAQRVALARPSPRSPRLLLLDEPLAALDAGARALVRAELRRHLREFAGCTVLVTHDPLDAMVLADRVVVVEQGGSCRPVRRRRWRARRRTAYVAGSWA